MFPGRCREDLDVAVVVTVRCDQKPQSRKHGVNGFVGLGIVKADVAEVTERSGSVAFVVPPPKIWGKQVFGSIEDDFVLLLLVDSVKGVRFDIGTGIGTSHCSDRFRVDDRSFRNRKDGRVVDRALIHLRAKGRVHFAFGVKSVFQFLIEVLHPILECHDQNLLLATKLSVPIVRVLGFGDLNHEIAVVG